MEMLEFLVPFFIFVLIFVVQVLKTVKRRPFPSSEEEVILETLGFPFPKIPKPFPPEKRKKIVPVQPEKEKIKPRVEIVKPVVMAEIKPKTLEFLGIDRLQEGIILSVILGPPKSKEAFCRGVGTGIRSGLKNRWP